METALGSAVSPESRGDDRSWPLTSMPPASAGETEEQLDGHAAVQIDYCLGAEDAVAFPAPHRISFSQSSDGVFIPHVSKLRHTKRCRPLAIPL